MNSITSYYVEHQQRNLFRTYRATRATVYEQWTHAETSTPRFSEPQIQLTHKKALC
jgi:hypothetical protein